MPSSAPPRLARRPRSQAAQSAASMCGSSQHPAGRAQRAPAGRAGRAPARRSASTACRRRRPAPAACAGSSAWAGRARAAAGSAARVLSARSAPRTTSRDALLPGIVDHHRQLVGPQAVGALQHEVADLALHVLRLRAEAAVEPVDARAHAAVPRAQPHGARPACRAGRRGRCRDRPPARAARAAGPAPASAASMSLARAAAGVGPAARRSSRSSACR